MAQKGVDIRIGLDIAWISLKRVVDVLVLVTGDSDFVPVMKFARKEGLKVYLETMGHQSSRQLRVLRGTTASSGLRGPGGCGYPAVFRRAREK